MYVNQPWTVRQYAGFSTAEDSNAFYRRNLAAGQKGLSVAFDLATHRGYDSDHPRVAGDVGMAGVAIDSIYDMRTLFAGIPARPDERVDDHERRGAADPGALHRGRRGAGRSAGKALGHDPERHPERVHGAQHLHLPARRGRCASSRTSSPTRRATCRSSTRSRSPATTCRRRARRRTSSSPTPSPTASSTSAPGSQAGLDRRPVRAAPVVLLGDRHELLHGGRQAAGRAPALGEARAGLRSAEREVAAACAPIARPRAGRSTAQDVFNNVARTCIEAMAATQGHTQSLHTNALDEALALPTDFSARIARNTQLFLQQESGTTRIIDPWGGSYYVERLTYDLAAQGVGPHRGGRGARRHGEGHRGRHSEAQDRGGGRPHAGADRFRPPEHRRRQLLSSRPKRRRSRSSRSTTPPCAATRSRSCGGCKAERRQADVDAALAALSRGAASGDGNLLDLAVKAARAKATVGEISDALETVWGRHVASIRSISGVYKREVGMTSPASNRCAIWSRPSSATTDAARASWSPRWDRTATTAARR